MHQTTARIVFRLARGAALLGVLAIVACGGRSVSNSRDARIDAAPPSDGAVDANVGPDALAGDDAAVHPDAAPPPDAGLTPPPPECTAPSDCTLHTDCCQCVALAPGEPPPTCTIGECVVDVCTQLGLSAPNAPLCPAGHCSAGANCDDSAVLCMAPTPVCDPGWVPSVVGNCWGPCVPASECASVNSCDQCDPSFYLCVTNSAQIQTRHCVALPSECAASRTCACMGPSSCVAPFDLCVDAGQNEIRCECPTC